jgi:hypothetical protein
MDSVGAYQGIDRDAPAVIEVRYYARSVIEQVREPMLGMQAFEWQAAQQSIHQIGAV